jgi:hypothetical protein
MASPNSPLQMRDVVGHRHPRRGVTRVGRVGRLQEVARAIVFLLGNGFTIGRVIECDGGLHLLG